MVLLSGGVAVASPSDYGQATAQYGPLATWAPDHSVRLLDASATYGEIYRRQLWVATLTDKLAVAQARLPFGTFERGAGVRTPTPDSAFGRLMRRPCPRHGRFFFQQWSSSTLDLYGEFMWLKVRATLGGPPVALWPMHPANLDIRRGTDGSPVYVHRQRRAGGDELSWPADDVVHVKRYNPATTTRGMSRLEPLRRTLLAEDAVQAAQESFWRRGARPSVLLRHPKTLSDGAQKRLAAQWEQLHGGAANWGKTAVLEEGVEAQVVQLSAQEMQMIEQRKISREEACSLYDVPPPVVHILDRATFSNVTEQMRSMYRDTMAPRLGMNESVVDEQLAPDFGLRTYGRFNLDGVLRGDPEKRAEAHQRSIYSGWKTPNEVRADEDMPALGPEGDTLYISSAMVPLATAQDAQPGGQPSGARPGASVRALSLVQQRLKAVAASGEGLAGVDLGVLTAGVDDDAAGLVGLHLAHAVRRGDDLSGLRAALADEHAAALDAAQTQSEGA